MKPSTYVLMVLWAIAMVVWLSSYAEKRLDERKVELDNRVEQTTLLRHYLKKHCTQLFVSTGRVVHYCNGELQSRPSWMVDPYVPMTQSQRRLFLLINPISLKSRELIDE